MNSSKNNAIFLSAVRAVSYFIMCIRYCIESIEWDVTRAMPLLRGIVGCLRAAGTNYSMVNINFGCGKLQVCNFYEKNA